VAVATMCAEFMGKLSLLYVTLRSYHGTLAEELYVSINRAGPFEG
jgi:hypothetical protein